MKKPMFCNTRSIASIAMVMTLYAGVNTQAVAGTDYDLCVRGIGPHFAKTIRLTLTIDGTDPGLPHAKILGGELARRRIWKDAEILNTYVEQFNEKACPARAYEKAVLVLRKKDAQWLDTERGTSQDLRRLAHVIRSALLAPQFVTVSKDLGHAYETIEVHFATNRNDRGVGEPTDRFTGDKNTTETNQVTYGTVKVSIPVNHEVGNLESPNWLKLEFWADPEKHIVLARDSLEVVSQQEWLARLSDKSFNLGLPGILLFVHGYHVSFEDAARRTAQLGRDMGFQGPIIFFSWPSKDKLLSYEADAESAQWSIVHFENLLIDLAKSIPETPIHIIAHSMGNRILTQAFANLSNKHFALRQSFREIVMAAPDMNVDIFKQLEGDFLLSKVKPRVTLYTHSDDMALKLSEDVHDGLPRLGTRSSVPYITDNLETIDASTIKVDYFLSPKKLLHSYYGDSARVLCDLSSLIRNKNVAPAKRGLISLRDPRSREYWQFPSAIKTKNSTKKTSKYPCDKV